MPARGQSNWYGWEAATQLTAACGGGRTRGAIQARGNMRTKSKRNRKSKSGMAAADKRGQARLSGQLDAELGFADRDMRAKCAEIAASLPVKPTDIASIIRDAQKLFDWIMTGKLRGPRMLNDGETIEPHSDTDADTDPSHGGPPKTESPPMPAATTLDNVVEQIVRHARDDNGGT